MNHDDDEDFLGSEDEIHAASGDELDLADTIARVNPVADQLQHFANMRGIKHAMLNKQAPFARSNPPSVLSGSLGNQVSLLPGQTKQVANWVGQDAETLPVTVELGPVGVSPTSFTGLPALRPFAIVQFGTHGALITAEVDIVQGCQFTIAASQVTLQIGLELTTAAMPAVPVPFTGMLSFHTIVRTQEVTRTKIISPAGGVGTVVVPVPAYGKSFTVWQSGLSGFQALVRDSSGNTLYNYTHAAGAYMFTPVPLSGDAAAVQIIPTAPGFLSARLIFNLAL